MRKGTPSAILFGQCLFLIRTRTAKKSMRQVGSIIGTKAATVSQIEKAQRALKEPKLHIWAEALGVDEYQLTQLWWATQSFMRNLENDTWELCTDPEVLRNYIHYCIIGLLPVYYNHELEIPDDLYEFPISRSRPKTTPNKNLLEKINSLYAIEKNQVVGYIDALLDQRGDNCV